MGILAGAGRVNRRASATSAFIISLTDCRVNPHRAATHETADGPGFRRNKIA
jgi:hypothetical protein